MKLINYKKYIKKYLYIIEIMSHQIKSNNEKVIIKENHKLYDLLDKHYVKKVRNSHIIAWVSLWEHIIFQNLKKTNFLNYI